MITFSCDKFVATMTSDKTGNVRTRYKNEHRTIRKSPPLALMPNTPDLVVFDLERVDLLPVVGSCLPLQCVGVGRLRVHHYLLWRRPTDVHHRRQGRVRHWRGGQGQGQVRQWGRVRVRPGAGARSERGQGRVLCIVFFYPQKDTRMLKPTFGTIFYR